MNLTKRLLTSKKARAALWLKAKRLCEYCSTPLGHSFHADHIVPWRIKQETNPHNMVAACAKCNLKKGGTYNAA